MFAVSATDGLLDYLPENAIVNHIAKGLYGNNKADGSEDEQPSPNNPLLASEDLIYAAAQGWQDDKGGRYRDDIAIAVTDLSFEREHFVTQIFCFWGGIWCRLHWLWIFEINV